MIPEVRIKDLIGFKKEIEIAGVHKDVEGSKSLLMIIEMHPTYTSIQYAINMDGVYSKPYNRLEVALQVYNAIQF